jgi:hypothetical protein
MLLTIDENCASGKSDTPPNQWFARERFASDAEHQAYLELHLIPKDSALWELDKFDDFILERKKLIEDKFSSMLEQTKGHYAEQLVES